MQSFRDFVTKERERLHADREAIFTKQHELETQLAEINREFAAIEAYEAAKSGKSAAPRAGGRKAPQARSGSKRDGIMKVIKENPDGLTRGELLEKMGMKGNKSGEMSVSNALTALTKNKQVARNDGKYVASGG
jgi:hypothetical protein